MIQNVRNDISFLDSGSQTALLQAAKSQKYRVIILLLMRCGLRVSECISLKWSDFDFARRVLIVVTLKKRGKVEKRKVPVTDDVFDELAKYYANSKSKNNDSYLFPSKYGKKGYISRQTVWKTLKTYNQNVYPHLLRHTCASVLVANGADALTVRDILGHESTRTTEIYTHISSDKLRMAMEATVTESWYKRMKRKYFPARYAHILPITTRENQYFVGRKVELAKVNSLFEKRTNIFLVGEHGIGKNAVLENITYEKVLVLDEFAAVKRTLTAMILELYEDDVKRDKLELLANGNLKAYLKKSKGDLIKLLIDATEENEYSIIIQDATRITPASVDALEKLKQHFHMVIAARQIKIIYRPLLSNFEKVELSRLSRVETVQLIDLYASDMMNRIEDYEVFKNHIWEQTSGNPLYTRELVDFYRAEKIIDVGTVKAKRHTSAHHELDHSLPLVLFFASFMVLRYVGGETGENEGAFKLIAGMALVFALFARPLLQMLKRRYI